MHSLFGAVRTSHRFERKQLKRFSVVWIMHEANAFGSVYSPLPPLRIYSSLSHAHIQSNQWRRVSTFFLRILATSQIPSTDANDRRTICNICSEMVSHPFENCICEWLGNAVNRDNSINAHSFSIAFAVATARTKSNETINFASEQIKLTCATSGNDLQTNIHWTKAIRCKNGLQPMTPANIILIWLFRQWELSIW